MKKITKLALKMELKGSNVVNYAVDNDQAVANLNALGGMNLDARNSNYNIPNLVWEKLETPIIREYCVKGNVMITKEQTHQFYLAISAEALRHAIFGIEWDSKNLVNMMEAYLHNLVSLDRLARGYQDTNTAKDVFHKKSCLSISQAVDKDAIVTINGHTQVGDKNVDDGTKSNTMYARGETGSTHYVATGFIDVNQTAMLISDDFFGQIEIPQSSIDKDGETNLLDKVFMDTYNRVPYTKGYFYKKTSHYRQASAQYGCHFDHEFQMEILKNLLKRMLNINMLRANAHASTSKLYIRPVAKASDSNLDNNNGFIEVESEEWIDNIEKHLADLGYEIEDQYAETSAEEIIEFRTTLQAKADAKKVIKEAEKEAEKKRKQEYKERKQKEEAEKLAKAAIESDGE